MTEPFELDPAAGEYVLGTLPADERRAFAQRLMTDPAAVAAVMAWRERLAPLDEGAADMMPSPDVWHRIVAAIGPHAANDNRRDGGGWRTAAIAAALVAMVSSGLALNGWRRPVEAPLSAVAALTPQGTTPAMLVVWHPASHRYEVRPIAMAAVPGRARQLWLIAGGAGPRSMGLVGGEGRWIDGDAMAPGGDATIAISDEPAGGSPTGAPTGPVILSGKLMRMPPAT